MLPLSRENEDRVLLNIINELNAKLALHLDTSPNLNCEVELVARKACYLVVGASSTARTADTLDHAGVDVWRAILPRWRCLKNKVLAMGDAVRSALSGLPDNSTVVIQVFDSSFFYANTEQGSLIPSNRQSIGGTHHFDSNSVFAPKELLYSTSSCVKEAIEAVVAFNKILISPLHRYINNSCCPDPDHEPNIKEAGTHTQTLSFFSNFLFRFTY